MLQDSQWKMKVKQNCLCALDKGVRGSEGMAAHILNRRTIGCCIVQRHSPAVFSLWS
jgi:hypothetical protein